MPRAMYLLCALLLITLIPAAFAQQDEISLPISEDVVYVVRPSDTLDVVGALFDVGPTCLAETNDILPTDRLAIGQELLISVDCPRYGEDPRDEKAVMNVLYPRSDAPFEDSCEGYRVEPNDTLDVIGQQRNVSAEALRIANDIERASQLRSGVCLIIPDDAPPYGVIPAIDMTSADGENLGMGGGSLPDIEGETYVVQRGDTLDVIGQQRNVSAQAIQVANNIERASSIQPGMTLIIPADAPPYGVFPALAPTGSGEDGENTEALGLGMGGGGVAMIDATGENTHVVQPRETLDVIAAFYNYDTRCLAEANDLARPGFLQAGQVLFIDPACPAYTGFGIPPVSQSIQPATPADSGGDDTTDADADQG